MIYFDANAGEILRPDAAAAMQLASTLPGNPSSVHAAGRAARGVMEEARATIAFKLGGEARHLVFTSGGTESDGLAIHALGFGRRLLYGATEHDAVRSAAAAADPAQPPVILPVDSRGVIRLEALRGALAAGGPALVLLMLANNETGVIHPIAEAAALCREYGALLHLDAVQGLGRIPIDINTLGADSVAVSAHKAGGPKGTGGLLLARDIAPRPLLAGGGQERGWRGGTQNVAGIAGFAAICDAGLAEWTSRHVAFRTRIAAAAKDAGAIVAGEGAPLLPNTLCLILPGVRADLQLMTLDLAGFAVSAGAACSSGKIAKSHVLEAMGFGAYAGCAVRVSLSWQTDVAQVDKFISAYTEMAGRLVRKAG